MGFDGVEGRVEELEVVAACWLFGFERELIAG